MGGGLGEGGQIDVRTGKVQKSEQSARSKAGRDEDRWHVWVMFMYDIGDRVQNNRERANRSELQLQG